MSTINKSIVSQEKHSDEEDFDSEIVSGDEEKIGNAGWADAMSKILHSNKPKKKKTLVLSRAKKLCNVVEKPKEEPLPFEIEENGQIKRETIKKEIKEEFSDNKKQRRKKDNLKVRVKPNVLDREREKILQKIATKGVVTLFNAVKKQQNEIDVQLKQSGPVNRKQEKVLENIDKNSFLDILMGGTKSIEVDSAISTVTKSDKKESRMWKVLRDDFVMDASTKNWDKESDESSENEINDTCIDEDSNDSS